MRERHMLSDIEIREKALNRLREALSTSRDVTGENFAITIDGHTFTERAKAAEALTRWSTQEKLHLPWERSARAGRIGGHEIQVDVVRGLGRIETPTVRVSLADVPRSSFEMEPHDFMQPNVGTITKLANRVSAIPQSIAEVEGELVRLRQEVTHCRAQMGKEFDAAPELAAAKEHLKKIDAQIAAQAAPPAPHEVDTAVERPEGGQASKLDGLIGGKPQLKASKPTPGVTTIVITPPRSDSQERHR